ncbi:hypothetical protein L915_13695 [Phytophthora nicotianae]|uniref:Uncharacterized protein n=1 Tax=Phytophthora nicotianae TaxID=4792 RepID=W2GEN2_PHYNI|nr:hypothetical protein L915_13695 [Phytophthora nicotianae]
MENTPHLAFGAEMAEAGEEATTMGVRTVASLVSRDRIVKSGGGACD